MLWWKCPMNMVDDARFSIIAAQLHSNRNDILVLWWKLAEFIHTQKYSPLGYSYLKNNTPSLKPDVQLLAFSTGLTTEEIIALLKAMKKLRLIPPYCCIPDTNSAIRQKRYRMKQKAEAQ
ncbi:MAG: hypothetical protein ACOYK8_01475 [Alphaproteobacteria bacterium]